MHTLCVPHSKYYFPYTFHPAYVFYLDRAGWIPICKESFDNRLDNADDDPEMEPLDFRFIVDPEGAFDGFHDKQQGG